MRPVQVQGPRRLYRKPQHHKPSRSPTPNFSCFVSKSGKLRFEFGFYGLREFQKILECECTTEQLTRQSLGKPLDGTMNQLIASCLIVKYVCIL